MTTPDTSPDNENYLDDESDECSLLVEENLEVCTIPDEDEDDE